VPHLAGAAYVCTTGVVAAARFRPGRNRLSFCARNSPSARYPLRQSPSLTATARDQVELGPSPFTTSNHLSYPRRSQSDALAAAHPISTSGHRRDLQSGNRSFPRSLSEPSRVSVLLQNYNTTLEPDKLLKNMSSASHPCPPRDRTRASTREETVTQAPQLQYYAPSGGWQPRS